MKAMAGQVWHVDAEDWALYWFIYSDEVAEIFNSGEVKGYKPVFEWENKRSIKLKEKLHQLHLIKLNDCLISEIELQMRNSDYNEKVLSHLLKQHIFIRSDLYDRLFEIEDEK